MPLVRHVGILRPLESVDKKKPQPDLSDALGQKKERYNLVHLSSNNKTYVELMWPV
jgi:hypothetical protein